MKVFSTWIKVIMLFTLALFVNGCGGGGGGTGTSVVDTTSAQRGAVVQGPVIGATVFADNVAAPATRFVLDAGEVSAATDAQGNFFLPSFPSYDFVLVSIGGTDTITNQAALLLLAPAGSRHITPLTTLVALDTTQAVKAKIEALMGGTPYDSNVSTSSSPAILMLIKSAETAVKSVSDSIKQAAADAGTTVSPAQINYLQAQAWQQIALEFARTSQNLATPAGLYAALNTALTNAIAAIVAEPKNSNISSFASMSAGVIANNAVNAVLTSLGAGVDRTSSAALSTSSVKAESSLSSPTTVFATAINDTITALKSLSSVVVSGVTPNPYSPTPLPVVTVTRATIIRILTGASGGTGGTGIFF